jgi:hypothetical protein
MRIIRKREGRAVRVVWTEEDAGGGAEQRA